jgi:hypothetical protein
MDRWTSRMLAATVVVLLIAGGCSSDKGDDTGQGASGTSTPA